MSENGSHASLSAQDIAQRSAESLWIEDRASAGLGMKLEQIAPGAATFTMPVRADMTNGHGICHGGFIFALADTAFAYASNSYNQRCVSQHSIVTFLASGRVGEILRAEARERQREGRSAIYDVAVANGKGEIIAEFRGWSRTIVGTLF